MNDNATTVSQLRTLMANFVAERDWQPFHDPKNLAASIAIEAAELLEHFQWVRSEQVDALRDQPETMQQIREELADVLAYILSFANRMDIDLSSALEAKMKKNAQKYPVETFKGTYRKG